MIRGGLGGGRQIGWGLGYLQAIAQILDMELTEVLISNVAAAEIAASGSNEFEFDIGSAAFIIDGIFIFSTATGTDVDLTFNVEAYQKDGINLSAAAAHDLDWAFNLLFREDAILLHNTQLTATEPADETALAVDDNDKLSKYSLILVDEEEYHRVSALTSTTGITIYDGLVAEQADNDPVWQVYERKNLGLCFNKSTDTKLYVRVENNDAVTARTFKVIVKATKLA